MKELYYIVFKTDIWHRAIGLKRKQARRLEAVKAARREVNEWDDIPLSMQQGSLSRTLGAPKDVYLLKDYITNLCILHKQYDPAYIERLIKKLPLKWYDSLN